LKRSRSFGIPRDSSVMGQRPVLPLADVTRWTASRSYRVTWFPLSHPGSRDCPVPIPAPLALALAATLLSAAAAPSFYGTRFEHQPDAATLTELGRVLFFDRSLSASGRMACASCHDPAHAYGPPNALSAQKGGPHLDQMGLRPPPSLMYRAATPSFSEHYQESEGDDSIDNGPTGGFTWDGRAASVHDQAAIPLLAPNEMANASPAEVITRLARSPSAAPFQAAFGPHVLAQPELAWKGLLLALEVFQQHPPTFSPYSSKYDAFLRGQVQLAGRAARLRGLQRPAARQLRELPHQRHPARRVPALHRRRPDRPGRAAQPQPAGQCRSGLLRPGPVRPAAHRPEGPPRLLRPVQDPSLRNVATRQAFFHNGVYHRLDEAVRFYTLRDTQPQKLYRDAQGRPQRLPDDLPAAYLDNLNQDAPFGQQPGDKPRLTEAEVQDIVAFLKTLNDGYVVPKAAPRWRPAEPGPGRLRRAEGRAPGRRPPRQAAGARSGRRRAPSAGGRSAGRCPGARPGRAPGPGLAARSAWADRRPPPAGQLPLAGDAGRQPGGQRQQFGQEVAAAGLGRGREDLVHQPQRGDQAGVHHHARQIGVETGLGLRVQPGAAMGAARGLVPQARVGLGAKRPGGR
jgi:cytochrome c peroxidase